MRQYIADFRDPNTFAFFIFEIVVDGVRYCTHFANKSRYSYTADGELNDYSDVSTNGKARYYGRTPDRIRFQPGDIVEVTGYEGIELCVVAGPPRTMEECQGMMERCKERLRKYLHREPTPQEVAADYPLDDTDDTYCVLQHYGDGAHEHLPPHLLVQTHPKNYQSAA